MEKSWGRVSEVGRGKWRGERYGGEIYNKNKLCEKSTYPEAACNPKPREPPVTTITLPFKEKMLGKSWSSVSELDILKS